MSTRILRSQPENGRRSREPIIHAWIPDIYRAKGGIGSFSASLLTALNDWNPKALRRVILKNDVPTKRTDPKVDHEARLHFAGRWPTALRTGAFSTKLLGLGVFEKPDLVVVGHLHFAAAANLLRRLTGVSFWTMAYGVESWSVERPDLKAALHNSERILAISHYTRDRLLAEQSLAPERISLLACTFDQDRFTIKAKPQHLLSRYELNDKQPVILTVSRLIASEQYKGYDRVLRAMPRIRQEIPGVRYVIVGQGDDRPRIERLIQELGIWESVTLAGFIPDDELADYYNMCDVFAMPSKREGFGIVYLEAMSCGKPVLGGNKDGAIDALCNGELGALVDPDDTGKLATTLIEILRGTYPLPLMYQPEKLRARVIDIYGYERFRQTVKLHLDDFFGAQNCSVSV